MTSFMIGVFACICVYAFLPSLITRVLGVGVMKKGAIPGEIALTFDDGPHPVYTVQLLDLLKKYDIQATFFVVGEKAEQQRELIARMHREGHMIGIHNYQHQANWFKLPWTIQRHHVVRTAELIYSITGTKPTLYRPPWGLLTIADLWFLRKYTIVLWSQHVYDWRSETGRTNLKERLLRSFERHTIILLHDSGVTFGADHDAPAWMIRALTACLQETPRKKFMRIDQLVQPQSRTKRLLFILFKCWDHLLLRMLRIRPIDQDHPLLQIRIRTYRGNDTLHLDDGVRVHKGDLIAEMHLDNDLLHQYGMQSRSFVQLAIRLIRTIEQVLPQLSVKMETDPAYANVKALYGISMIHRGVKPLGFTIITMPNRFFVRIIHWYLSFLMFMIHPSGQARLKLNSNQLVPKTIVMSKQTLLDRYKMKKLPGIDPDSLSSTWF